MRLADLIPRFLRTKVSGDWRVELQLEQERNRRAHDEETKRLNELAARQRLIATEVKNVERIARQKG